MASGLLFNMRPLRQRNGARARIGVSNREGRRRTSTANACSPVGTLPMQEIRVDAHTTSPEPISGRRYADCADLFL